MVTRKERKQKKNIVFVDRQKERRKTLKSTILQSQHRLKRNCVRLRNAKRIFNQSLASGFLFLFASFSSLFIFCAFFSTFILFSTFLNCTFFQTKNFSFPIFFGLFRISSFCFIHFYLKEFFFSFRFVLSQHVNASFKSAAFSFVLFAVIESFYKSKRNSIHLMDLSFSSRVLFLFSFLFFFIIYVLILKQKQTHPLKHKINCLIKTD